MFKNYKKLILILCTNLICISNAFSQARDFSADAHFSAQDPNSQNIAYAENTNPLSIASTQNMTSEATATSIDLSAWSSYSQSIKNCTPGTFLLPDMFQILINNAAKQSGTYVPPITIRKLTYTIQGWQDGKCGLVIIMPVPNESGAGETNKKVICAVPPTELEYLAKSAASFASQTFSSDDHSSDTMNNYCK